MTSTVINNSASIHEYRGQIAHAIDELRLNLKKTEQAIETVGETWKDDNFREFQDNFNQDKEQIIPLCNVLDNYQSNLLYQLEKKLERLEGRRFKI
jgi:uncharacterized protein YukE